MKRTQYQQGCLYKEKRKASPAVWAFRFRDGKSNRKVIVGDVEKYRRKLQR